jgi:hypothetical protein
MPAANPLTLIVLVGAGQASDATTHAMTAAVREALGPSSHVSVREAQRAPSDAQALESEREDHADAVVEVTWLDAHRRQATLRVHVAQSGRWVDRSMAFRPSDADTQRGRAMGFAVASILPEPVDPGVTPEVPSAPAPPVPPNASSPPQGDASAPAAPNEVAASATPSRDVAADRAQGSQTATGEPPNASHGHSRTGPRFAVDALAIGASGTEDGANGVGGAAAVHWFVARPLSLRVGGGMRGGSIDAAQASTRVAFASAGLAVHPWVASPQHPIGASLRVDCLLENVALTHLTSTDPNPVQKEQWIVGADALVGGTWRFAEDVELVASAGVEDVFSSGYVSLNGARVATIPPLRLVGETGLRLLFW